MAKVIGAYYLGGSVTRYPIARIPADRLTHLFYAFARIEDGRCVVGADAGEHFAALAELKHGHPHLRTLISIGGWEAGGFSDAARTATSRKRFVASCIALFLDGHAAASTASISIGSSRSTAGRRSMTARPQDRRNMTSLAREFRRQLDEIGKERGQALLLTAALPAGRLQSTGPYDPRELRARASSPRCSTSST